MLPSFEEKENCLKNNISHVSYSAVNKKERIMSEKENSYDDADNDDVDDDEIYLKQIENGDSMVLTKSNVSFHQNFADCSNVFKAFIGSAMIGLPFAVHQAGIGLAIIGIIVIAIATDHCCALIVKVKRLVISKIGRQRSASKVSLPEIMAEADLLGRTLSFGGIGKVVFGKKGVLSVNIAIMTTQIGFTTGYFIFLGNTMRSVLKTYLVHPNHTVINSTKVPAVVFRGNLNDTLTAGGYNAIMTPYDLINTTLVTPLMTSFNAVFSDANNASTTNVLPQFLHSVVNSAPLSPDSLITNSTVTFGILLLIPLPILVLIAFIRKLRKLGPISVIANTAILGAFAATATYIIFTMKGFSKEVEYFKFATFPIFYGQVTSAFEGIGTVIPIEGSMAENRARYPLFLHGTIVGISLILGSFGIVGYSAYGDGVCQIITSNLSGIIPTILQCLLFVGVLFTYPLQIYPCIEITEHLVVKYRKWRMARKMSRDRVINSDEEGLLEKETAQVPKPKVKTWEGNLIRVCLVTFTAVLGLFFRSQFAYMAALTGSIGSSFLLYILPPAFHIALTRKEMKWYIFAKDVLLIIFGIVGGGVGVTIAIQEMVESFSKGHPVHC